MCHDFLSFDDEVLPDWVSQAISASSGVIFMRLQKSVAVVEAEREFDWHTHRELERGRGGI